MTAPIWTWFPDAPADYSPEVPIGDDGLAAFAAIARVFPEARAVELRLPGKPPRPVFGGKVER